MPENIKIPPIEIKDTGTIQKIQKGLVRIGGLSSCINGQLIELGTDTLGMVIGFTEEEVLALVLGDENKLNVGDTVYTEPGIFEVPVGNNFTGRIVNGFGRPADGKGPIQENDFYSIFTEAPGIVDRIPIDQPLLTGIKIIDSCIPLGKGQRELIIGDRVTGKTTLASDIILNQKGKDMVCIYCWIGGSFSAFTKLMQELRREGAMEYSIIVSAMASDSPAEQYLAPFTACALGEYLMHRGKDVLVAFDNLTRHAWVYRQLSLLLERSPGREAYPGDIFYLHSRLMEKAAKLNDEKGGGSMTFLPIVETQEGDITGLIPSNLIAMTDGQIYVDSSLFHEGFKPAIDLGLSVSRIGNKVQSEAMRQVSAHLKAEYSRYRELVSLTRVRTKLSPEVEARLKKGEALCNIFIQDKNTQITQDEQVILFYAFNRDLPELLEAATREKFIKEIFKYLQKERPELVNRLVTQRALTEDIKKGLDEAFMNFFEV